MRWRMMIFYGPMRTSLISRHGEIIVGLIDFDHVRPAPPIFDIAYALDYAALLRATPNAYFRIADNASLALCRSAQNSDYVCSVDEVSTVG
jgi:aminoglycoside phosphotransferase (APT) family kinase protein